jgi:hypothetical protein
MLVVPVQAVPNQSLTVTLANQSTKITLQYYDTFAPDMAGLFMGLYVNDAPIITSVICQNANRIVRDAYLGFIGDFVWVDTQPQSINGAPPMAQNPYWTGLGTRWFLIYLEASDLSGGA